MYSGGSHNECRLLYLRVDKQRIRGPVHETAEPDVSLRVPEPQRQNNTENKNNAAASSKLLIDGSSQEAVSPAGTFAQRRDRSKTSLCEMTYSGFHGAQKTTTDEWNLFQIRWPAALYCMFVRNPLAGPVTAGQQLCGRLGKYRPRQRCCALRLGRGLRLAVCENVSQPRSEGGR